MGFLKRLWNTLFGPEPTVIVAFPQLNDWLATEEQKAKETLHKHYEEAKRRHTETLTIAHEALVRLEQAALRNPNIPGREKQIMEGNRTEYARRVRRLLEYQLPETIDAFHDFTDRYLTHAKEFADGVRKPLGVLQHFFAHESREVVESLKAAEHILLEFGSRELLKREQQLQKARREMDRYNTALQRKKELAERRATLEKELVTIDAERFIAQKDIETLKNSQSFQELEKKKEQLQALLHKIKAARDEMLQHFTIIEPALNRYVHTHVQHKALATSYLKDPLETLARDRAFLFSSILHAIDVGIQNGSLDVAEKRREKVRESIAFMKPRVLDEFVKRYGIMMKERDTLLADVQSMPVLETMREHKKHLDELDTTKAQKEEELTCVVEEYRDLDELSIYRTLCDKFAELLGVKVVEKVNVEKVKEQTTPTTTSTAEQETRV